MIAPLDSVNNSVSLLVNPRLVLNVFVAFFPALMGIYIYMCVCIHLAFTENLVVFPISDPTNLEAKSLD